MSGPSLRKYWVIRLILYKEFIYLVRHLPDQIFYAHWMNVAYSSRKDWKFHMVMSNGFWPKGYSQPTSAYGYDPNEACSVLSPLENKIGQV